jgi:hypothetical protein
VLNPGDHVPGGQFVARWCRRRDVSENRPKVSAFEPRPGEQYLSGNWLEYYSKDRDTGIRKVIKNHPLTLDERDRFVVLEVDQILDAISIGGGHSPSVTFKPEEDNPSHVAMKWDGFPLNDQIIASELLAKVTSQDIYPRKIP